MYDNTAFSLRWRNTLESMDAGVLLFRMFALKIWLFLLPLFMCTAAFFAALPNDRVWTGFLVIWWLNPLWDRLVLRPLSILFFSPDASLGSLGKGLLKGIGTGLAGDLTYRRFALKRYFALPVRSLEGLKRQQLRKRIGTVSQDGIGAIFTAVLVVSLVQIGLLAGETTFIAQIIQFFPSYLRPDIGIESSGFLRFALIAYSVHQILLIPLRVCMTFALYLNKRITVEGWDLEITFRTCALKANGRKTLAGGSVSPVATVVFILLIGFVMPGTADAQEGGEGGSSAPLVELQEILKSPDFGGMRTRSAFRWKQRTAGESTNLFDSFPSLSSANIPAWTLRALAIAGAVGLAGWVLWANRNEISWPRRKRLMRSGDVEGAEEGGAASASVLYEQGFTRQAWARLYQDYITELSGNYALEIDDNVTEGMLLDLARGLSRREHDFALVEHGFRRFVQTWQRVAYDRHEPDAAVFYDALGLLKDLGTRGEAS